MITVFWFSVAGIGYCYLGYSLFLNVLSRVFARPVRKGDLQPSVSVLIAVWNEQDVIQRRIVNLFEQKYPADKMEILIGSDGSDDGTNEILREVADPRVRCLFFKRRRGKMAVVNDLVKESRNEILVFCDARQLFERSAVKELVRNFADPQVGCVSGELVFCDPESGTAQAVGLYWKYEKALRRMESRWHSMLGATGAIYSLRRHLFRPIPEDLVLDDMYVPFQAIRSGFRAVFDDSAVAFDHAASCPEEEFSRKARTLYGNFQIFSRLPEMFVPFRSPVAWQLFSHKALRLAVPYLMVLFLISNAFCLSGVLFRVSFGMQFLFYLLAIFGSLAKGRGYAKVSAVYKISSVAYMFCVMNSAAVVGFFRFVFSGQRTTWDKARHIALKGPNGV